MLDPLWFSARVASELGRLGRARLRGRRRDVPARIDDVDARWLEQALSARFPGTRIASLEVVGGTAGTTQRHRLALRYAPDGRVEGAPDALFAKLPPAGLVGRFFVSLFDLGVNEVSFYRDVRPGLPVAAPECFAARVTDSGAFALILEDLEPRGAEFSTIAAPLSLDRATAVTSALATLHAAYWGLDLARRWPWLPRPPRPRGSAAVERLVGARAHAPTLKRFADLLPESVRRGAARIHAERRALERYWASGPLTLIHGDPHVGNIYFVDGRPGFFDWQVVQCHQGVRDLAYFLILSLAPELRREQERALFDGYLERLGELGVPPAERDPDRLWDLYRSFSLYAYIGASVTASLGGLQAQDIARVGLHRAATAVDDLEALPLLDRLA